VVVAGQPRILLVEDDHAIRDGLRRTLEREAFDVLTAAGAAEALALAAREGPDLVLLDLGLPDGDGRDVCRELRRTGDVPVIMLTARGTEVDRIVGLELGADDYVVKPFSGMEVVARIRAVLRRTARTEGRPGPASYAGTAVDAATRRATVDGRELDLTRREFDVLTALVRRGDAVASREELFDEVWGGPWYGSPKVLDVQVSALRRKLAEAGGPDIEAVRGVGYRLAA
jgi:DNA-binding response OmpR family regulator